MTEGAQTIVGGQVIGFDPGYGWRTLHSAMGRAPGVLRVRPG